MTSELLTALIKVNLAASVAVALVLLLRAPLRRLVGARAAYGLWLTVPIAMAASLAPPRLAGETFAAAPIRPAADAAMERIVFVTQSIAPAAGAAPDAALLICGWLAGVAGFVLFLALGQHRAVARFGLVGRDGSGYVRAASRDAEPALIGFIRPRIVLPTDFEARFAPREQAMILAHEQTHLKEGHLWINALVALIRAFNWFNPLIHIGAHYAGVDQELACDAAVVERFPGERRTYAQAMLKSQLARVPLPLGCAWPSRSNPLLKERIEMLALKSPKPARRLAGGAAIALVAGLVAYGAWAAQPPRGAPAPPKEPIPAPSRVLTPAPQEATAPGDQAGAETALPGQICLTNACDDVKPVADRSAAIAAAIAAGDPATVVSSGGSAENVVEAMMAMFERTGDGGKDFSGRTLRERYRSGTATWATNPSGRVSLTFDLNGGGYQTVNRPEFSAAALTANTPDVNELRGRPSGSTAITVPDPNHPGVMAITGYRAPDGTILPSE